MLNPSKKYGRIQEKLQQCMACIFAKTFNPGQFFPLMVQFTDDPDLKEPATLLFSIYNLLIRQQPETAFNGLIKIQNSNPNSIANVTGIVVKSAYQAYKKKYKQSLDSLKHAIQLTQQSNLDRQFSSFYSEVIARMLQIFDFGAFRRDYLSLMDKILNKYQNQCETNQILKVLLQQKNNLKDKACLLRKKEGFGDFGLTQKNTIKQSKYSLKLKLSRQQSNKSEKQKSLSSSKKSSLYSPRSKYNFKAKDYVNPYGLTYASNEANKCIFM